MKEVLFKFFFKKVLLDNEFFKNYRLVFNLMFFFKFCEKIVVFQFNNYLCDNNFQELFQSVYKNGYSIEFVFIRVQNDVLCVIDDDKCVILLLFDFLVVFDIVDYGIFFLRLFMCYGIEGIVYKWFRLYFCDCKQFVVIENVKFFSCLFICGVLQGFVFGLILYLLYIVFLGDIMCCYGILYYMYVDDMQIYLMFKLFVLGDMELFCE